MDQLLKLAVEAHGGLRAWNRLRTLTANVSIGGALCWYNGNLAYYIQTEASDETLAQQQNVNYGPRLSNAIAGGVVDDI